MTTTYTLTCIQHVVEIATTLSESWFRGHACVFNNLTPKIFREPFSGRVHRTFRPAIELDFIETFKRDSPTLAVGHWLPSDEDDLGWLYLMQHYGRTNKTPRLDKERLVALWFAVTEHNGEDGELWAMYPRDLNDKAGTGFGIPIIGRSKAIDFLAKEPYWRGTPEEFAKELSLPTPVTKPVAFEPKRVFPRMVAQSSMFTIHPAPAPGNTIPELLSAPESLARWIIPAHQQGPHKERPDCSRNHPREPFSRLRRAVQKPVRGCEHDCI